MAGAFEPGPSRHITTNREEKSISHRLNKSHETAKVALHEVDEFIVQADIYNYLTFHLSNINGLVHPIEGYVKYLTSQTSFSFMHPQQLNMLVMDIIPWNACKC